MLRIIILSILSVCINNCLTQDNFEFDILNIEKEYYLEKNDTLKQKLILDKIDLLLANNQFDSRTFSEIKRIKVAYLDSAKQSKFFWNAALISYLNKETYHAINYLKRFANNVNSESVSFKLLYVLNSKSLDSVTFKRYYTDLCSFDTIFNGLECIQDLETYELKHKKFLLNSGIVLPGVGAIFNGNVLKGFTSLGLNALSFVAIRELINQKMYINAIGWGANLFGKFYMGNLRMTENLIEKKEYHKKNKLTTDCELILKNILLKYPFEFK